MAAIEPPDRSPSEFITAAIWNQDLAENQRALFPDWDAGVSWTPNIEGSSSGSVAALSGRRFRVGPLQFVWARFSGIANTDVVGTYSVTLPVAASGISANAGAGSGQVVGSWQSRDASSLTNNEGGAVSLATSTSVHFNRPVGGILVSDSVPFTWVSDDVLSFHAVYPVA